MKVKAVTLGCKVNAYESEYILSLFKKKGYEITDSKSDIYIINTCSVTNTSDSKSRKVINKIIRENEGAVIVVMGCMIEAHKDYQNDKVSIIIGNKDKSRVVELVEEYIKTRENQKKLYKDFDKEFEDMFIENMENHTRAFVKIQDGCENFCSYCIIPYTRGRQRSKQVDTVIEEIKTLVKNSYQEIVLTGIHTGHYGSDLNTSFPSLLKEIMKIEGLKRLRISSIEITELNDEFMEVLKKYPTIVSHLHVPLQSGSDTILKLMNRKYLTDYFENKIKEIRKIRPDISISTDIIVGFPYETEELFQETLAFAKKMEFSKIHVFPYSKREGTKASEMDNQVSESIKKERVKRLLDLNSELENNYLNKFLNKKVEVLIEENKDGSSIGHTGNYLKVLVRDNLKPNTIVDVYIKENNQKLLIGDLYENESER